MTSETFKRRLSESFDKRSDYNKDNFHGLLAEKVVALARPQPGDKVLDIATGTGLAAIEAARLVGPTGHVTAIDISQGMLDKARIAISVEGLANVDLALTDAELLEYPEKNFDIILCVSAIPYMTDVKTALRLWYELLKPGGRIAFNCWSEASYVTGHLIEVIANRHGIELPVSSKTTGTSERCCRLLTDAGFVKPEVSIENSGRWIPMDQVKDAWEKWIANPIFQLSEAGDARRLTLLYDEYLTEARNRSVNNRLWDEMIAYFVVGEKQD